jgi:hypothetical protein
MTNIGANIDHQKAKKLMEEYFGRMTEMSKNKNLPSRIRFMILASTIYNKYVMSLLSLGCVRFA